MKRALPYLLSLILHGIVWASIGTAAPPSRTEQVSVDFIETPSESRAAKLRPRKDESKPLSSGSGEANEVQPSQSPHVVSQSFDLSLAPSHPYFRKIWKQLASAQQDLGVEAGDYFVHLQVHKDGQIDVVGVNGPNDRGGVMIMERLRRLAFLHPIPDEVSQKTIAVHYRVEISGAR